MMYQVERLQIQWQFVEAESEAQAIEFANACGEWDTDDLTSGQELYYGTKAFALED